MAMIFSLYALQAFFKFIFYQVEITFFSVVFTSPQNICYNKCLLYEDGNLMQIFSVFLIWLLEFKNNPNQSF